MKSNLFVLILAALLLTSCTWVKPTKQGSEIKLVDKNDSVLRSCKKLGSITSIVKHKIGSISRSEDKVNLELITIAKNEAVEMEADTIAAEGPAENGRRAFSVYTCME